MRGAEVITISDGTLFVLEVVNRGRTFGVGA